MSRRQILIAVFALLAFPPVFVAAQRELRSAHASASTHNRAIPAGLERAIHRWLGPGPISLGAPSVPSRIVASGGGWEARFPSLALAARIGAKGGVSARLGGLGTASLIPASVSSGGARVTLSGGAASLRSGQLVQRLGPVISSYKATASGLEQQFIVERPLTRAPRVVLGFSSNVRWRVIRAGSAIVPRGGRDGHLAYAGLRAIDARGLPLSAFFRASAGRPAIVLDTSNAVYPVTIDPTWTSSVGPVATLSNGGNDYMGFSVALSADGTTALVGDYGVDTFTGAVDVFHVSSEGSWTSSSKPVVLTNSADGHRSYFGGSVKLSGDGTTAFVSASGANGNAGAVFVYHASSEAAWATASTPAATLTPTSNSSAGCCALALSPDGTTLLASGGGAAYVFHVSSESGWATTSTPTAVLTNASGLAGSVALSTDGTIALVGASKAGSAEQGAAYVYHASSASAWASTSAPTATLTNSSGKNYDHLGVSVALSADGTTALVGAPVANPSGYGAAYIFQAASETAWASSSTPTATLTNTFVGTQYLPPHFGASVALSSDGTTAVMTAPLVNNGVGAAYLFHVASETGWATTSTPTARLTASSGLQGDGLGNAVTLAPDGTTALIGAVGAEGGNGAAYVFHVSAEGSWATTAHPAATLTDGSGLPNDGLGAHIAISSDGTTALVGASGVNNSTGAAYIFHVSSEGAWRTTPFPTAMLSNGAGAAGSGFGGAVALSADGTTALIGAPNGSGAGDAYIFHVASEAAWATTATPTATLTNTSGGGGDLVGWSAALSPDGTTAVVGAPGVAGAKGAAYVFHAASESGWASTGTPTATLTNSSGAAGDQFGGAVSLSSDGTTALAGAEEQNSNGPGAAYVFQASSEAAWATTGTPKAILTASSGAPGDEFGAGLSLSSDGTTALVGASQNNNGTGAAYIFHASAESTWATTGTPTATLTKSSGASGDAMGSIVALSADGTIALTYDGAVFNPVLVFQVSSEGSWSSSSTPTATLEHGASPGPEGLGSAIAISSDAGVAMIGAVGAFGGLGAVYVFSEPPSSATHALSVSRAGTGSGTVKSTDGAIDCGSTCAHTYAQGSAVTLGAAAAAGSRFAGWSGACTGTGSCGVTMNSDEAVTATFIKTGGLGPTQLKAKIKSGHHEATFIFSATGARGFQCALVRQPKKHHKKPKPSFLSCRSPKSYKHLKTGKYTFEVRPVGSGGPGAAKSVSFRIA